MLDKADDTDAIYTLSRKQLAKLALSMGVEIHPGPPKRTTTKTQQDAGGAAAASASSTGRLTNRPNVADADEETPFATLWKRNRDPNPDCGTGEFDAHRQKQTKSEARATLMQKDEAAPDKSSGMQHCSVSTGSVGTLPSGNQFGEYLRKVAEAMSLAHSHALLLLLWALDKSIGETTPKIVPTGAGVAEAVQKMKEGFGQTTLRCFVGALLRVVSASVQQPTVSSHWGPAMRPKIGEAQEHFNKLQEAKHSTLRYAQRPGPDGKPVAVFESAIDLHGTVENRIMAEIMNMLAVKGRARV